MDFTIRRFFRTSIMALGLLSGSVMPGYAAKVKTVGTAPRAAMSAYYYTPMGLTYMGTDKNGNLGEDLGYAPVSFWLQTAAEVSGGKLEWEFPSGLNDDGTEKLRTATSEELQFRMTSECTVSAPVLTVTSGDKSYAYSTCGKIQYGAIGTPQNFAVNYLPSDTQKFDLAAEALTLNDASATTMLNMAFAGGLFSNIKVYGFAESFYYGKDFWLQAIGAELQSDTPLSADDVALLVFERYRTSVTTTEIGDFHVTDVNPIGDDRYYVTFEPEKPIFVTTAMQVVVTTPAGSSARFSPVIPLQNSYHASNAGTASLYADFNFGSGRAKKQYLDFFGTELEDESGSTGFLNHWNIGIYGSYTEPASVECIPQEILVEDAPVYNMQGIQVGMESSVHQLPQGLYFSRNKGKFVR